MKFFYFILLVLISYGCQPKDELKFANFNKETTLTKDVQKNYILKKNIDEDIDSTNENPSTTKINISSKEEMISNLYKSFKSDLYTSRLIIKKSKEIVIGVKPKQTINFDYKKINRNKTLESYNFYFKIKNNISPLQITVFSNYHINLIEKLFGFPHYIRMEDNIITWQYRFSSCVADFFYNKDEEKVIYSSIRSRKNNLVLNQRNCFEEVKNKIFN